MPSTYPNELTLGNARNRHSTLTRNQTKPQARYICPTARDIDHSTDDQQCKDNLDNLDRDLMVIRKANTGKVKVEVEVERGNKVGKEVGEVVVDKGEPRLAFSSDYDGWNWIVRVLWG